MTKPDYANLLTRGNIKTNKTFESESEKVNGSAPMRVLSITLDDISYFLLNPRRADNPKFEEIKESIRTIGLENPLTVTKRPGDAGYTLYNGGNTRLKALKELWQETKDLKYFNQDCRFAPFQSDSEVLIRHMVENETRGDMILIDKAMAVYRIKQLEEERSGKKISLRNLSELLGSQGWKIGHTNVGLFLFAAEKISDKLPLAFANGMGTPKVNTIRKTYHAIKKYLDAKLHEVNAEAMQQYYLDSLSDYDQAEYEKMLDTYALTATAEEIGRQVTPHINRTWVLQEINYILETGEVDTAGSRRAEYNHLGQYIGEPEAEAHESEAQARTTDAGVETITTAAAKVADPQSLEQKDNQTTEAVSTAAVNQADSTEDKIQRLREYIRFLRMRHPILEHCMYESEDVPFFGFPDTAMDEIQGWLANSERNNLQTAALINFVKFYSSYHYGLALEGHEIANSIIEQIEPLQAQLQPLFYAYDLKQFGFSELDNETSEVSEQFSKLSRLLRDYVTAHLSASK